jgi:hypothetical protein
MFLFCSPGVKPTFGENAAAPWPIGRHAWSARRRAGFPYWVALLDEKCTGANHEKIREFCRVNGLTLSRFGAAVVWEKERYQVFRFGSLEDADHFMREFGGERMHPSERGKGKRWAQWRKGSYRP